MKYLLKLYVMGQTKTSEAALKNIKRICEEHLKGEYQLETIDLTENIQLAEEEKIIATPTLVKELPEPLRRVVGGFSDTEKVLVGLDLIPR